MNTPSLVATTAFGCVARNAPAAASGEGVSTDKATVMPTAYISVAKLRATGSAAIPRNHISGISDRSSPPRIIKGAKWRRWSGFCDALLAGRGLLSRIFRPLFGVVSRLWHMYPIGFRFGLGFDTATEIGLLGISATQAAQGMSFWTILVFPALFTAGMSLMDTTDSVLMTGAYGWAFINPIRKLRYNLTITTASVVVAIFIGGIEALGLLGDKLGLEGRFWDLVGNLNDNLTNFGFAVVGIFIASWLISTVIYKTKGNDSIQARQ